MSEAKNNFEVDTLFSLTNTRHTVTFSATATSGFTHTSSPQQHQFPKRCRDVMSQQKTDSEGRVWLALSVGGGFNNRKLKILTSFLNILSVEVSERLLMLRVQTVRQQCNPSSSNAGDPSTVTPCYSNC